MSVSASWSYRAVRPDGSTEVGTVQAATASAASGHVRSRGLLLLEVTPIGSGATPVRRVPMRDLALGLRMLSTLLESGLPVGRALGTFQHLAPRSWHSGLPAMRDYIREGRGLSTALSESFPGIPAVVVGIIQAGESGAGFAAAVARAADLCESEEKLRAAIRSAAAYPALLAITGAFSVALLVGVILPRFALILSDLGQALPPATRMVLAAAGAARALTLPMVLLVGAGVAVWRTRVATPAGLQKWHACLLSTPLIGTLRLASASARTLEALSALLDSGVPLAPALGHAARAAGDAEVSRRIFAGRERIIQGERISSTLSTVHAVTPASVGLIRAGEESGQLARMLRHAAFMDADQVQRRIHRAVRLLEPALILVFGGIIAFVAMALLQAVYAVRPA